tara:strand:+ start:2156 stop:3271 length:1116 start_codon:yes stop_codon:yes gene_type:complete
LIQVFKPKLYFSDIFSATKALIKNDISGSSPLVNEFEEKFSSKFDRKFGVAVSNGSVALDLALNSINLKKGDEVILPSFTIISCLSAVIRSGATPVLCDVDKDSWNMTLQNIKNVYTSKTKAILMVHTYGLPSDAIAIGNFCKNEGLILIEDSAEAHGLNINNNKAGSFGLMSTFSFYANKHITTGEGGMILTDDEKIYNLLKQKRNLDFTNEDRFNHSNLYWNYRLGGIQAAIGISQINKLQKTINFKHQQGEIYQKLFSDLTDYLQMPLKTHDGVENDYWVFGLVIKKNNNRQKLVNFLSENNIQTRPFFWPLHKQKYFKESSSMKSVNLPVSEDLGKNGFYIPMGRHVSKKDQIFIKNKIDEFFVKNI